MYYLDYHSHTGYSFDGEGTPEALCLSAIEKGMDEIAITDHMDIYSLQHYNYILNCPKLYADLRSCRDRFAGKLKVTLGAELGQPMNNPESARRFLADYPDLDFVIGSIHCMENDLDVYYYNWKKHDPIQTYDHYLDWLIDYAENYDFDVLGHITYPLRYMANDGICPDIHIFYEKMEHLFRILIRRDKGIELNVSGLRQTMKTTMPTPEILQLYHETGGRILTIGSDSHCPADIGHSIPKGIEIAKNAGFRSITRFEKRVPVEVPIL
ncbi:MAG: histidinol-phosphatase HisJ family protein [Eubacteriales bacterium]|nr:histidinol-phosphatase HisJ family protein [Eubacteriales bacterium]